MSNSRAASAMGASRPAGAGASTSAATRKSYFEQQRGLLLGEIAMSFEQVLANINKLNRSLEAVVTVGNEFSAVEALWSQFEGVMAKEPEPAAGGEGDEQEHEDGQEHEHEQQGKEGEETHEQHDDDDDEDEAATQLHEEEAAATTGGRGRARGGDMDFDY